MMRTVDSEPPTLLRLNALLAADYRIDQPTSQEVGNAVWFDHFAVKRVRERKLILFPTGLLVSNGAEASQRKQVRFNPDQETEFNEFVKAVPIPTLWERTLWLQWRALVYVFMFLFFAAVPTVFYLISKALEATWAK